VYRKVPRVRIPPHPYQLIISHLKMADSQSHNKSQDVFLLKNPSGGYHRHRNIFRSARVGGNLRAVRKAFQKAAGSGKHVAESKSRRRDLNPQSLAEEVV
jgi:hypothetical protein